METIIYTNGFEIMVFMGELPLKVYEDGTILMHDGEIIELGDTVTRQCISGEGNASNYQIDKR